MRPCPPWCFGHPLIPSSWELYLERSTYLLFRPLESAGVLLRSIKRELHPFMGVGQARLRTDSPLRARAIG